MDEIERVIFETHSQDNRKGALDFEELGEVHLIEALEQTLG
ncbi:hypothetical protein [Paracoccus mutanolyticus]|nr:hypothetical protein [Paracoccus mutanolyticus]